MDLNIKPLPKSIRDAVNKSPMIIGIGPSAWPRVVSGYYFPKFKVLCSNDNQDNELIRKAGIPVYSQKQVSKYLDITPITPGNMIATDLAKNFLKDLKEPFIFLIYKSMGRFEKVCEENGWKFIGNKMEIRDQYENKKTFKEIIRKLGLRSIPGDNLPISKMTKKVIADYQKKFEQKALVLQIAEATWGGGSGTFFINNSTDFQKFIDRANELYTILESTPKRIETVNIAPYITGTSASIPCCATKFGTYTGSVQTQLVDIPEAGANLATRSGVFSGHDWCYKHFSPDVQKQATEIGRKFGDYLYKNGYKGIFGLDLIVDEKGTVWPVECNPRETDAFPLITMLQMEKGAIPMQVFHNLEHLNLDYQVDFEEVDKTFKESYFASQILIYNREQEFMIDRKALKAGVYKMNGNKLKFVRPGFATWHIKKENEFLLTEDISKVPGVIYDPHERMLRLIRKGPMVDSNGKFRKDSTLIVNKIYESMKLVPARIGFAKDNGLGTLYAKRLKRAGDDPNIKKVDLVNSIKNNGFGIRRPLEIAWRMDINKSPIIGQIKSQRTQKHVVSDLKKASNLDVRFLLIPEIDAKIFSKWYILYKKIMGRIHKGQDIVGTKWFQNKKKIGKKVGAILAYQNDKLIGGELFMEKNGTLGIGYGIAEKVDAFSGSLTLLLDYKFLEYAQKSGYNQVSFGQDGNLYGYDLSPGLILYKTKIGFTPVPAKKTFWVSSYITNAKKFKGDAMIFSGDNVTIDSLTVLKNSAEEVDYKAYLPKSINKIKVIKFDDFVAESNRLIEESKKKIKD